MRDEKPWAYPAAGYADSGGVTGHRRWQTIGNNGTQSQGLLGDALCSTGCMANHGKPWDCKTRG